MVEIEWQSSLAYQPTSISVEAFRDLHGIPQDSGDRGRQENEAPLVYIAVSALTGLNTFLESDLSREHGGVLLGLPYTDSVAGQTFVDIRAAIPAMNSDGSPTTLQFNPQAWDYISGLIEESFPGHIIVGWFHSHPGLSVYMSGTDRATQRSFYSHPWNLALVVDPLEHTSAWFVGPDCIQLKAGSVVLYQEGTYQAEDLSSTKRSVSSEQEPALMSQLGWFIPAVLLLFLLILWLPDRIRLRG